MITDPHPTCPGLLHAGDLDAMGAEVVRASLSLLVGATDRAQSGATSSEVFVEGLAAVLAFHPPATCPDCLRFALAGFAQAVAGLLTEDGRATVLEVGRADLLRMAGETY